MCLLFRNCRILWPPLKSWPWTLTLPKMARPDPHGAPCIMHKEPGWLANFTKPERYHATAKGWIIRLWRCPNRCKVSNIAADALAQVQRLFGHHRVWWTLLDIVPLESLGHFGMWHYHFVGKSEKLVPCVSNVLNVCPAMHPWRQSAWVCRRVPCHSCLVKANFLVILIASICFNFCLSSHVALPLLVAFLMPRMFQAQQKLKLTSAHLSAGRITIYDYRDSLQRQSKRLGLTCDVRCPSVTPVDCDRFWFEARDSGFCKDHERPVKVR